MFSLLARCDFVLFSTGGPFRFRGDQVPTGCGGSAGGARAKTHDPWRS